jgi:hypothetical protein
MRSRLGHMPTPPEKPIEPAAFVAWYCHRNCIRPDELHRWVNGSDEQSARFAAMRDAWIAAIESLK